LGAQVTGVDFSAPAIELARRLAEELDLDARFLCCALEGLAVRLPQRFEIVFSSYGVLSWLSDLRLWAQVVADHLAPGGRFHLIELHPFAGMFDDEVQDLRVRYPYSGLASRSGSNAPAATPFLAPPLRIKSRGPGPPR
jgi:SAM-dependent methyltransferase